MRVFLALLLSFLTLSGLFISSLPLMLAPFLAVGWLVWYLSGKLENLLQSIHQTQIEIAAQGTEIMTHNARLLKLQAFLNAYEGDFEQLLKDIEVAKKVERVESLKRARTEGNGSPEAE